MSNEKGTCAMNKPDDDRTVQAQFEQFHQDNPDVFLKLEQLTADWLAHQPTVGMKMLWEVLRWQTTTAVSHVSGPKFNNNYTSRYARLILEKHPEWVGRIRVRELRAA